MSTRRARIKAVTSLPPRRKNNDIGDKNKQTIESKDEVEKILKSPKTPRSSAKNQEGLGRNSPKCKIESALKSPRGVSNMLISPSERITSPAIHKEVPKEADNISTSKIESPLKSPQDLNSVVIIPSKKITSPAVHKEILKEDRFPTASEQVSDITNASSIKPLFASPRNVSSPMRKPTVPTLRPLSIEIGVQKLNIPQNAIESSTLENKASTGDVEKNEKSSTVPVNLITIDSKNDISDDYNVPSVPESVTEDGMDGIIPLKPVASAPKPIALLKNEIISENAEVLFDPIVPLPSPSKVRPKLRPVPRLNPIRRNSIQGSASESEDESRRAHLIAGSGTPVPSRQRTESHTSLNTLLSLPNRDVTRVRNDSVCSSISQLTNQQPAPASPLKEKHVSKARRHDTARRTAAMRRRRETVKRDALTMYDLIFYNPTSNPIVPNEEELKAKEANEKEDSVRKSAPELEEKIDDPPAADGAPVPQIKLGPNGEIILDEQSLVIKQSENRKVSSSVVVEGSWSGLGSGRYKRGPRSADWSDAETVRFFRALAALGTDFMLMESLFPGRSRRELKLKFKKEERMNAAQVDKALRQSARWDAAALQAEFAAERDAAQLRAKREAEVLRQRARDERTRHKLAKELRVRQSKAAKALESSILPDVDNQGLTADDFIKRHLQTKAENTRKRKLAAAIKAPQPIAPAPPPTSSPYAQLTVINTSLEERRTPSAVEMATIQKLDSSKATAKTPDVLNKTNGLPSNIETGSLVVLTVDDPKSPTKKMLQTYIASSDGKLTPVALPPNLVTSVVSYMKKGTPRSTISDASSPSSIVSHDSRSTTPGVVIPSPAKRQRHSSYTITQL